MHKQNTSNKKGKPNRHQNKNEKTKPPPEMGGKTKATPRQLGLLKNANNSETQGKKGAKG